jgi:hypothetical protein
MPRRSRSFRAGGWSDASLVNFWINNVAPTLEGNPSELEVIVVPLNSAMTSFDLRPLALDQEGDEIVVTTVDALPPGLSVTSSALGGTATVRGIYRNQTLDFADITGDSVQGKITIIAGNVDVPSVVGLDEAAALELFISSYLDTEIEIDYGSTEPVGTVTQQSPVGGSTAAAFSTVVLSISAEAQTMTTRQLWVPLVFARKLRWLKPYTGLRAAAAAEADGAAVWARRNWARKILVDVYQVPGYPRPELPGL